MKRILTCLLLMVASVATASAQGFPSLRHHPVQEAVPAQEAPTQDDASTESPVDSVDDSADAAGAIDINDAVARASRVSDSALLRMESECGVQPNGYKCKFAKAEHAEANITLLGAEGLVAEAQAGLLAAVRRELERQLEEGPDLEKPTRALGDMIDRCEPDDEWCAELRTRIYALIAEHWSEYKQSIELLKEEIRRLRSDETTLLREADEQYGQQVVSHFHAAELRFAAAAQESVEQGRQVEELPLQGRTIVYPSLVGTKQEDL